jgi:hypothetical protein
MCNHGVDTYYKKHMELGMECSWKTKNTNEIIGDLG